MNAILTFHARTLHILIMTDLFFATYGELVLLTKAWKMYGSFRLCCSKH